MTGFSVKKFTGVIPRVGSRYLPDNGAQIANNVKLYSGEIRSWLATTAVNTPSKGGNIQSCYRMYSTGTISTTTSTEAWLAWTDDVDAIRGQIAADTSFKLYFTGDTTTATNAAAGPRKTNLALATTGGTDFPHDWLEMGVPAPGSAPAVIGTGGTSAINVTRVYTYTYVTSTASWAEESGPSPGGTGTGKYDATWVISGLSTGTTGKYAFGGGIKRIYRTLTDNAGNTNYQLALDTVPIATTSTNDTVADASLGAICPSFINGITGSAFDPPPSDLKGLVALPNGIFAGFSGNSVCFCEPYLPYAWPKRYQLTTNFPIVSLGVFGNTLVVTTKGPPYFIIGVRPDSMSMQAIEDVHPCLSKRGTVSFPFGVIWPTPDGLILAGVAGVVNLTANYMVRKEYEKPSWLTLCWPSTLIAHRYMDAYFGFFQDQSISPSVGGSFIFDKTNPEAPLSFGNLSVQGAWSDPETSRLYLMQGGVINEWDCDANNPLSFDWKSKTFVFPNPINFGAIQVEADYGQLSDVNSISTQSAADLAINNTILNAGDLIPLPVWVGTTVYGTASVIKSADGAKMAICMVSGTSSSTEFAYSTVGGTSTDGGAVWKRIWDIQGVTKGDMRGQLLRDHIQYTTADPGFDGIAGNQWGFPLRGSLMIGGQYPNILTRSLMLQVYAKIDNSSTGTGEGPVLISQQNMTSRAAVRLPRGIKSDSWEIRLTGNVAIRYFKLAETMQELSQIQI